MVHIRMPNTPRREGLFPSGFQGDNGSCRWLSLHCSRYTMMQTL